MTSLSAEDLYRLHAPFVTRFLARLGVPMVDLEDVVQEVFLVAHRAGGYVAGAATPTTYLASIAVRAASGSRRTRHRQQTRFVQDEASMDGARSQSGTPEEHAQARQAAQRISRIIDGLEFDKRVAFVLYEIEAMSCEQIAEICKIPMGTVYSRLHSARKKFDSAYGADSDREVTPERAVAAAESR